MAETHNGVAGKHTWRDPTSLWRFMLAAYIPAIVTYLVIVLNEIVVWFLYAGLISIEQEPAAMIDKVAAVFNLSILPLYVICAIVTLLLLYRLVENVHALGAPDGMTGSGMAVASFLIPIVSLFMPPNIMGKLWRAHFQKSGRQPNGIIAFWWTTFMVGNVMGVYLSMTPLDQSPEAMQPLFVISAITFICRALAALTLLSIFGALVKPHNEDHAEVLREQGIGSPRYE